MKKWNKGFSLLEMTMAAGMVGMLSLNAYQLFFRSSQFTNQIGLISNLDYMSSRIVRSVGIKESCGVFLDGISPVGGGITIAPGATFPLNFIPIIKKRTTAEYLAALDAAAPGEFVPRYQQVTTPGARQFHVVAVPADAVGAVTVSPTLSPTQPFSPFYFTETIRLSRVANSNILNLTMRFRKVPGTSTIWSNTLVRTIRFKGGFDNPASPNLITSCAADEDRRYAEVQIEACAQIRGVDPNIPADLEAAGITDAAGDFIGCPRFGYGPLPAGDVCDPTNPFFLGFAPSAADPYLLEPQCGSADALVPAVPDCPAGTRPESFDGSGWGQFTTCTPVEPADIVANTSASDNCTDRVLYQPNRGGGIIDQIRLEGETGAPSPSPPAFGINCPDATVGAATTTTTTPPGVGAQYECFSSGWLPIGTCPMPGTGAGACNASSPVQSVGTVYCCNTNPNPLKCPAVVPTTITTTTTTTTTTLPASNLYTCTFGSGWSTSGATCSPNSPNCNAGAFALNGTTSCCDHIPVTVCSGGTTTTTCAGTFCP